jgi:hypothetical protein
MLLRHLHSHVRLRHGSWLRAVSVHLRGIGVLRYVGVHGASLLLLMGRGVQRRVGRVLSLRTLVAHRKIALP